MPFARLSPRLPAVVTRHGALVASVLGLAAAVALVPTPMAAFATLASAAGEITAIDAVAVLMCSLVVWTAAAWVLIVATFVALARMPGQVGHYGHAALRRIAPPTVRRVVIASVGLSMVTGTVVSGGGAATSASEPGSTAVMLVAAPVSAQHTALSGGLGGQVAPVDQQLSPADIDRPQVPTSLGGLPTQPSGANAPTRGSVDIDWPIAEPGAPSIDWPDDSNSVGPQQHSSHSTGQDQRSAGTEVVVLAGDTLWSIAAAHLGPDATDADIDAAWRAWHSTNRAVIGDDPDLILPGQRLVPPPTGAAT